MSEEEVRKKSLAIAPLLSSQKMDWYTPENVLYLVRKMGGGEIALDPSTDGSNPCKANSFFTPAEDGLSKSWEVDGIVYSNPPFGKEVPRWAKKFSEEGRRCNLITLTPARTDTKWFQEHMITASAMCFWKGRIRFVGAPSAAPFPAVIAYWGNDTDKFKEIFSPYGWIPQ